MLSATTTQTQKEIFYVASPSTILFIEADPSSDSLGAQTSGVMLIQ
jgi:hypothetical protein